MQPKQDQVTGPSFTLITPGVPLYRSTAPAGAAAVALYYALLGDTSGFPPTLTAAAAWSDWTGAFVLLPSSAAIKDPDATRQAISDLLQPQVPHRQWVLWLASAEPSVKGPTDPVFFAVSKSVGPGSGNVTNPTSLAFANLTLQISAGMRVDGDFGLNPPAISLVPNATAGTSLTLQNSGEGGASVSLPNDKPLLIPLEGDGTGLWSFSLNTDRGLFYALFSPADGSESPPASSRMPLFLRHPGRPHGTALPGAAWRPARPTRSPRRTPAADRDRRSARANRNRPNAVCL